MPALGTGNISLQNIIDHITDDLNAGPDVLAKESLDEAFTEARANASNGFVDTYNVAGSERLSEFRGFDYQADNSVTYGMSVGISSGSETPTAFGMIIKYTINVTPDTSGWTVTVDYTDGSGWISISPSNGTGDVSGGSTVDVTVQQNTGTERVATLRFRNSNDTSVDVFRTITQAAASGGGPE